VIGNENIDVIQLDSNPPVVGDRALSQVRVVFSHIR